MLRATEMPNPLVVLDKLTVDPARTVGSYAIGGAVLGALLASTIGLAGRTIGPGNRAGVLSLIAIPVAGAFAGVLIAKNRYDRALQP